MIDNLEEIHNNYTNNNNYNNNSIGTAGQWLIIWKK